MRAFERIARFTPGDAICEVATSTTKWFFVRTSSASTRKNVQAACGTASHSAEPLPQNPSRAARASTPKSLPHARAARSLRPAPDVHPLPSCEHPAAPARKSEIARSRSRRSAQPEPLLPWAPKPARTALRSPCRIRHAVRPGARCRVQPVLFFRLRRLPKLGTPFPFPRPPLPPAAFPSQPPPLVGVAPSRPQRPLASRHHSPRSLSRLSYSLPRATPLFWLPAASSRFPLHPPGSARLFLRAASHTLHPCRTDRSPGKGRPTTNK